MAADPRRELVYQLLMSSPRALLDEEIAAELNLSRLVVLAHLAALSADRKVTNCLVRRDGARLVPGSYATGVGQRAGWRLTRIVSDGQSGPGLVTLEVARRFAIPTGGWAVRGWLQQDSESGTDRPAPCLADFGLIEHPTYGTRAERFRACAVANLRDSHGTLVFVAGTNPNGLILARNQCYRLPRPHREVAIRSRGDNLLGVVEVSPADTADWIVAAQVGVLNVSGRESGRRRESARSLLVTLRKSFGASVTSRRTDRTDSPLTEHPP